MIKLSIIIPVLKRDEYCEELLASLDRALTRHPEITNEIILIEGVRPVGEARNRGLEKATGEYVWFVDGDDLIAEWALDVINPVSEITLFKYESFAEDGKPSFHYDGVAPQMKVYDLDDKEDAMKALRIVMDGLVCCNAWYKRDFIGNMRLRGYKNGEDWLWGYMCFFRAKKLGVIEASPYGYRNREGSASKRQGIEVVWDYIRSMAGSVLAAFKSRHPIWYLPRFTRHALGVVYRGIFPRRKQGIEK